MGEEQGSEQESEVALSPGSGSPRAACGACSATPSSKHLPLLSLHNPHLNPTGRCGLSRFAGAYPNARPEEPTPGHPQASGKARIGPHAHLAPELSSSPLFCEQTPGTACGTRTHTSYLKTYHPGDGCQGKEG